MKRFWITLCLAIASVAGLACNEQARDPSTNSPPDGGPAAQRIVSVAPSATEILFALGVGDRIVGRTEWCVRPAAAKAIPSIGGYATPSLEAVLGLAPDCVVYVPSIVRDAPAFAKAMTAAGAAVVPVDMAGIDEVRATILQLGRAVGAEAAAVALEAKLHADLERVRTEFAGKPHPRVMVTLSHEPHALFVAGQGSFIGELLELAGAVNAVREEGYFAINAEALLSANPDVIIDAAGPMEDPEAARAASKALWARFSDLPAVRDGRLHLMTDASVIVPGPRMPRAVRLLAALIHGEGK